MLRQRIVAIGLAPILLAQGFYVRRVTPRLPEASGDRSGLAGTGPPLRLLIAGDSAAAGVGVATQRSALSGLLAENLSRDFSVSWRLISKTGNTIDDAVAQLDAEIRESFDVAVVSIGVNDVTRGTPARRWLRRLDLLADLLVSKAGVRHTLLSAIPPMHAFPALPNPLAWYLGANAQHLNGISREWAGQGDRCEFAQPPFPLAKDFIASDGFHPGPAAYALWAEHLAALIRQRSSP